MKDWNKVNKMLKFISIFLVLLMQIQLAISAEIYAAKPNSKIIDGLGSYHCGGLALYIKGTISKGDTSKLDLILQKIKGKFGVESCNSSWPMTVHLESEGGSVDQAMELGRYIRENELSTHVSWTNKCYSSCALIFAGGVRRTDVNRGIGIHRPYFYDLKDKLTPIQVRQEIDSLNKKIEDYLQEMDISKNLLDAMLATPPNEIKVLSESELKSYRLTGEDMAYSERYISKQAKFYNMSSFEYRKKYADADRLCMSRSINDSGDCRQSVLLNITETEYKKRYARFLTACDNIKNLMERTTCAKKYIVLSQ